jgi:hypothetical protein
MDFWRFKNYIGGFLIGITVLRLVVGFMTKGVAVVDLVDGLLPMGGGVLLIRMKPKGKNE